MCQSDFSIYSLCKETTWSKSTLQSSDTKWRRLQQQKNKQKKKKLRYKVAIFIIFFLSSLVLVLVSQITFKTSNKQLKSSYNVYLRFCQAQLAAMVVLLYRVLQRFGLAKFVYGAVVGFWLQPIYSNIWAASKVFVHVKSGQKWQENSLVILILIQCLV